MWEALDSKAKDSCCTLIKPSARHGPEAAQHGAAGAGEGHTAPCSRVAGKILVSGLFFFFVWMCTKNFLTF